MFGESTPPTVRAEDHSAMQTLAPASLSIVMTAINHARAKGHCQVQPLHVAKALLDPLIRSVALDNACRESLKESLKSSGKPPHPLQCNALDLCFKVALERLPVITDPEKCKEQTMSNALAAALKRAHANERRGTPEQSLQPLLAVKTGTAHLTISILDDPSVSRVFREAGFSSTDVKAKMEETVTQAALACSHPQTHLFDSSGTSVRRMPYAVPSYCNPRLDSSVQLRSSPLSVPSMIATVDSNGRRLKYSLQDMQLPETGRVTRPDADVALFTPQHNRLEQAPLFPRQMDNSSRFGMSRHDAEIRKIVETILSPKKRNPVLLSDRRAGPVLKEFSQRLARGEVPLLFGVKMLELPFTSLSVGMLSPEAVEQKLAKLRRDVDGCMPTGGAIVSVGDLQWLLEPSQSIAPLVLQQLHQLLNSNASNRLWLLATSSPDAFKGFQFNRNPSLEDLALQPIELTCDTKDSPHLLRYGNTSSSWSGQAAILSQLGSSGRTAAASKPSTESDVVEPDLCAECYRSFQMECASLDKEDRPFSLEPGMSSSAAMTGMEISSDRHAQHHNLRGKLGWGCDPLRVKEEEGGQIPRQVDDVRKAWRLKCSTLHSVSESSLSGSLKWNQFTSPFSETASRSERNARNMDLSYCPSSLSKPISQPATTLTPTSRDRIPLHARIAQDTTSRFLSPVKPLLSFANGDAEKYEKGSRPDGGSLNWSVKNGPSLSMSPSISRPDIRHAHGTVRTDLVLGRSSVDSGVSLAASVRNKQEGQQPAQDIVSQQSLSPKSEKVVPSSGINLSLHGLSDSLGKSVPWQKAAVGAVAVAVLRCRSGEGPKMGAYARTNSWLMFLGPDGVGKREVAKALAKCVFGGEEHLIVMTGWSSDNGGKASSSAGILAADITGKKYIGRTPLERLAEAVRQNPCSVILLEDIDRADYFLMRNLLRARHTGKVQDSSGREVSLANVIIVMTCDAGSTVVNRQYPDVHAQGFLGIREDAFCGLSLLDFKLQVHNARSAKVLHTTKTGSLSIVDCAVEEKLECPEDRGQAGGILIFGSQIAKRKTSELSGRDDECSPPAKKQRSGETSPDTALCLDLNLSAGEVPSRTDPCVRNDTSVNEQESLEDVETQVIKLAQERFPGEMFTLLDGMVVFKPFNMRGLTNLVLEKLEQAAEDAMPKIRVPVEIDRALLQVIVFSAWQYFCTLEKFQVWVDSVLVRAMSSAMERSLPQPDSVLKLVALERRSENGAVSSRLDPTAELLPKPILA